MNKATDSEKNLLNYLHLYLGCRIRVHHEIPGGYSVIILDASLLHCILVDKKPERFLPILRRLDTMTEQELFKMEALMPTDYAIDNEDMAEMVKPGAELTRMLLIAGFDLFGLIDAGLAVDANAKPVSP